MVAKQPNYKEITTDILSVGGGGAGVTAAIAGSKSKVKTTLVLKGALGRSGNTIMVGGSFAMDGESAVAYGYDGDPLFTKEVWFEEIVKQGFYLSDQKIVETYVDQAAPLVKQVVDWGQKANQYFHFFKPGGFFTSGKAMGRALKQGISEHPDINVIEDIFITDLLTRDHRCVGAIGIDVYSGEVIVIKAKAVIIGTGGFQPFSLKVTASDMTGDGIGMALRGGVSVADMEFPLYVPGVCLWPPIHKGSIFPFLYNIITSSYPETPEPKMINSLGRDISKIIPPDQLSMAKGSEWMKLIFTYWWGKEIVEGRGSSNHGIYFSFEDFSGKAFLEGTQTIINMLPIWYKDLWKYQGDDISDLRDLVVEGKPWEVGLGNEYSNGGIMVNEKAQTELPGFYAAGECSTGCFGAHRVHDALVEMLVQGHVAGEYASHYIKNIEAPKIDREQVKYYINRICSPLNRKKGVSPLQVRKGIEKAADKGFNLIREEKRMKDALSDIQEIKREMIPRMSTTSETRAYNQEWIESIEAENLLLCLEAGLRAAIERKESRGTHIRSDYPEVDHDNFLKRICFKLNEKKLDMFTSQPNVTRMDLPKGKVENIMEYALSCEPKFKNAGGNGTLKNQPKNNKKGGSS